MINRGISHLPALLLPLLVAAYPVLFLYGRNADALTPLSLRLPLSAALLSGAAAYGLFFLLLRRPLAASLAAAVFVVFYHTYGFLYRGLVALDILPIEHYLLLPVVFYLAGYAAYFLGRLRPAIVHGAHKVLLLVAAALVAINALMILPAEVRSASTAAASFNAAETSAALIPLTSPPAGQENSYPDIYYIVFDEYAGFNAIRSYWKDDYVDEFEAYLAEKGFFLADQSRSNTLSTVVELASRLDLRNYTEENDQRLVLQAVRQNRVMQILKAYGYTTVAMDMAFHAVEADVSLQYDVSQVGGMAVDEFQKKFIDDTLLLVLQRQFMDHDPPGPKQRDILLDTLEKTANLGSQDSPKFVYTHILLPHKPFIFDEHGNLLDPSLREDWSAYLGQHKYSTVLAMQLIDALLANADPENPPVIIFQSDHGARNINRRTKDEERLALTGSLENYPMEHAYDIINALYLPGFDQGQLSKGMNPTQTFAIVLNHYLGTEFEVEDPQQP